jgi:hypothetical protein
MLLSCDDGTTVLDGLQVAAHSVSGALIITSLDSKPLQWLQEQCRYLPERCLEAAAAVGSARLRRFEDFRWPPLPFGRSASASPPSTASSPVSRYYPKGSTTGCKPLESTLAVHC